MKKRLFILIVTIITTLMIVGCYKTDGTSDTESSVKSKVDKTIKIDNVDKNTVKTDLIESTLKNMTITEKIGQMTIIGIYGHKINEDILYSLHQYHFGGVILFTRNIESKEQLKRLISDLQNQSDEKVPLFIAIDEEGGQVSRLSQIENEIVPSQQEIGSTGDPKLAMDWAIKISNNLKNLGINTNFAPVADVGSPDTRSFSDNPSTVTNFLDNATRGYEESNIIYCLKHFPGIGKRITDPHQELSSIDVSRETLEEDLLPFKSIISNHPSDKFMIMVSHLKYPAIDSENSATLSEKVMNNLLREELGYDGIIITDDLEMGAIANHNTFSEAGVKAIKAGADIVLICHEYQHEQEAYLGILEAYQNGEISEERINESVRRILKVKLQNLNINDSR